MQETLETQVPSLAGEDPLEEGMAIHSSVLAWRVPMDRGARKATVHSITKSRTRLKWLSTHMHKEDKLQNNWTLSQVLNVDLDASFSSRRYWHPGPDNSLLLGEKNCPVHHRVFGSIPDLYPLDDSAPTLVVATKSISKLCHRPPGERE